MHIEPDTLPTGHAGIAARLKKGPTIHSSAWVVPGATVIGDVTLEEESSVWYGAVLRGDINRIIIGPRSNVQDNAVVHLETDLPTAVGELVTIGHSAVVHACKVDNEVLVGHRRKRAYHGGDENSGRFARTWVACKNSPPIDPR